MNRTELTQLVSDLGIYLQLVYHENDLLYISVNKQRFDEAQDDITNLEKFIYKGNPNIEIPNSICNIYKKLSNVKTDVEKHFTNHRKSWLEYRQISCQNTDTEPLFKTFVGTVNLN